MEIPGFEGRCLKVQMLVLDVVVEYWWHAPQLPSLLLVWFEVNERSSYRALTLADWLKLREPLLNVGVLVLVVSWPPLKAWQVTHPPPLAAALECPYLRFETVPVKAAKSMWHEVHLFPLLTPP